MVARAKEIYGNLQDEESRMIFEKRLMFSVSGNEVYIAGMVHSLIGRHAEDDSVYRLLRWLETKKGRKVVIFGSGCASWNLLWILGTYHVDVACLCDNDVSLHGRTKYGKKVISPGELEKMKTDVCVVVGVNWYTEEICRQLQAMEMDADDVFAADHGWWLGKEKQYFASGLMQPGENEVFVDAGAFTGEDTLAFWDWCGGNARAAFVFEPDGRNYLRCRENLKLYGDKVEIYPKGLWSRKDKLFFTDGRDASSHVGGEGNSAIETVALDEILAGKPVSFIKMDIEGAELEALKGAAEIIRMNKPKLAVCLYHKPEDIVEIPAYIQSMDMGYRFYLRHYSYSPFETVLYAV